MVKRSFAPHLTFQPFHLLTNQLRPFVIRPPHGQLDRMWWRQLGEVAGGRPVFHPPRTGLNALLAVPYPAPARRVAHSARHRSGPGHFKGLNSGELSYQEQTSRMNLISRSGTV